MIKIIATLMLLFVPTTNAFAYEFSNTKNLVNNSNSIQSENEFTSNPVRNKLFLAQTVISRQACGSWFRINNGPIECCAASERPVCYNNGGCQCERDRACASNTLTDCPF